MNEEVKIPLIDGEDSNFKNKLEFALWSSQSCSDFRNDRERPYDGQPWTDNGIRGKTEVKGLTLRDLVDCLIKAMIESSPPCEDFWKQFMQLYDFSKESAKPTQLLIDNQEKFVHTKVKLGSWRPQDVYKLDWLNMDPIAICQNFSCEVEKMMGIFPNIPKNCVTPEEILEDLNNQGKNGEFE